MSPFMCERRLIMAYADCSFEINWEGVDEGRLPESVRGQIHPELEGLMIAAIRDQKEALPTHIPLPSYLMVDHWPAHPESSILHDIVIRRTGRCRTLVDTTYVHTSLSQAQEIVNELKMRGFPCTWTAVLKVRERQLRVSCSLPLARKNFVRTLLRNAQVAREIILCEFREAIVEHGSKIPEQLRNAFGIGHGTLALASTVRRNERALAEHLYPAPAPDPLRFHIYMAPDEDPEERGAEI